MYWKGKKIYSVIHRILGMFISIRSKDKNSVMYMKILVYLLKQKIKILMFHWAWINALITNEKIKIYKFLYFRIF